MNEETRCETVEVDPNCEIVDSNLCYWLSHQSGCSRCYVHTLKKEGDKKEAAERWETTLSLLPKDFDALHESGDCQFCKGEIEKKDGYAFVEMAHPEPYYAKGMIFGLGKKVRTPVGSLVSVQAGVCKKCRRAYRAPELITMLTPVVALVIGILLLMIPQIGQAMGGVFLLLPLIFLVLVGVAGYFAGVSLSMRYMKKKKSAVKMDISEVPQISEMLKNGWFFFQTTRGVPHISFSKKKQFCRLFPDQEFLEKRGRRQSETSAAQNGALEEAYRSLDLSPGAAMEQVEEKYRALRLEFDPRKHPEHKALYSDLTEKVERAYALIKKENRD